MEAFDFNAVKTLCGFGKIKKLFRVIEIFIVLVILTWAFLRLPSAVIISGEYLRRLVKLVAGHLFVFFLANVIVLILFFKSRNIFLHRDISEAATSEELCRRFIGSSYGGGGGAAPEAEEIVYQDKGTILEVTKVRVHRRSQSENFRREGGGDGKELRRSETERRRRVVAENEEVVEEEMSNEEFQRSIEEFIAKQVKFHQEEKLAIVCN